MIMTLTVTPGVGGGGGDPILRQPWALAAGHAVTDTPKLKYN